jgi:tRNA G18 (ribose-2'-O)-methylase SpoU
MIVLLDNLRSAQNVGSIIRTCDAFGVKDVYFCGITPSPENKKVLKTSLGAEKSIRQYIGKSTTETIKRLKNKYYFIALEVTPKSKDIKILEKNNKEIALVIGNEVSGIPEGVLALCNEVIQIPMKGSKESLNVAVAFGIATYQIIF